MAAFGNLSTSRLSTCHPDLWRLFQAVVKEFDCSVSEGARTEKRQGLLFREGRSKVEYPNSLHNPENPRNDAEGVRAVDVIPYPFYPRDWVDTEKFYRLAEVVQKHAKELGLKIRWGGDWDGDGDFTDQTFNDLPHWELR